MATLEERRRLILLMIGSDPRDKALEVTISDARKCVTFCEIALRHSLVVGQMRRDLYQAVKQISATAADVVGAQITGKRTVLRERALLADQTRIVVPLTVRQHWLIIVAAKLAVENPLIGASQRAIIEAFEQRLIQGLDADHSDSRGDADNGGE